MSNFTGSHDPEPTFARLRESFFLAATQLVTPLRDTVTPLRAYRWSAAEFLVSVLGVALEEAAAVAAEEEAQTNAALETKVALLESRLAELAESDARAHEALAAASAGSAGAMRDAEARVWLLSADRIAARFLRIAAAFLLRLSALLILTGLGLIPLFARFARSYPR